MISAIYSFSCNFTRYREPSSSFALIAKENREDKSCRELSFILSILAFFYIAIYKARLNKFSYDSFCSVNDTKVCTRPKSLLKKLKYRSRLKSQLYAYDTRPPFPNRVHSRPFASHAPFLLSSPLIPSSSLFRSLDISDISRARINSRRGRARAVVNRELSLVRLTSERERERERRTAGPPSVGRNKTASDFSAPVLGRCFSKRGTRLVRSRDNR